MSDTKALIKYVHDRLNDGSNNTFGKPTVLDLVDALEQAEAENVRLTKMVDWLAKVCAMHCSDKCADAADCSISHCLMQHCRHTTSEEWVESARRVVAAGEEPCQK